jgi:hypothetical protein
MCAQSHWFSAWKICADIDLNKQVTKDNNRLVRLSVLGHRPFMTGRPVRLRYGSLRETRESRECAEVDAMKEYSKTSSGLTTFSRVMPRAMKTERSEAWLSRLVGVQEIGGPNPPVLTRKRLRVGERMESQYRRPRKRDRSRGTRALRWAWSCQPNDDGM